MNALFSDPLHKVEKIIQTMNTKSLVNYLNKNVIKLIILLSTAQKFLLKDDIAHLVNKITPQLEERISIVNLIMQELQQLPNLLEQLDVKLLEKLKDSGRKWKSMMIQIDNITAAKGRQAGYLAKMLKEASTQVTGYSNKATLKKQKELSSITLDNQA